MDDEDDRSYSRAPRIDDLVLICRALNESGARYLLIGGFAVIAHGAGRTTKDIDFLVSSAPENIDKIKSALSVLADNAAAEIDAGDVAKYSVVRIADEVIIDLMAKACNIDYEEAIADADELLLDDVPIPLASKKTLILTKRTTRPMDQADRNFLQILLDEEDAGQKPSG